LILALTLLVGAGGLQAAGVMVTVPAGEYHPLLQGAALRRVEPVAAFLIEEAPVTNAEFLEFVRTHPQWRRSRVSGLFADSSYLARWAGDLELGPSAPPEAPVVQVSWFAARAYARSLGRRLPTMAEWERAAAAGWDQADARTDARLQAALYRWLASPSPEVLPVASTSERNVLGIRGLLGLVWEWVDDFGTAMVSGESRSDSSPDTNQFCGSGSVGVRDTADYAAFMRLALRSSLHAAGTTSTLGFRCASDRVLQP
jgi:formylglycine-generating enzyme required for sulfatase activity